MMMLRMTTNQGLEDVTAAEAAELLSAAGISVGEVVQQPWGLAGVVTATLGDESAPIETVRDALARARSIYHVVIHIGEVTWTGQPLEDLAAEIAELPFDLMETAPGFRASCSRAGEHPFQSPDVEAAVGHALQQRYGTAVDLTGFVVNVRVDIINERCLCGYQLTGRKGLDRRYDWKYHPRVTLRTTVAYSMLRLSGFTEHAGALMDPFCGSGTILLEAASLSEDAEVSGSDWAQRAVTGSRENLVAAGFGERVSVERRDARDLAAVVPAGSLDYIITNPPFGIRIGSESDLGGLYRKFLEQAAVILRPGGTLALLMARRRARFNRILQSVEAFTVLHVRIIEIGGVYPGLFILQRN